MEVAIVFLALFGTAFGIAYVFLSTRNKERLAMIEKGADASLFERKGMKFSIAKFILNIALLFMGIGFGIFTGSILGTDIKIRGEVIRTPGLTPIDTEITIPAMIFIFGGLGLTIGYFLTRKIEKSDQE